jgi:hypothetical protein
VASAFNKRPGRSTDHLLISLLFEEEAMQNFCMSDHILISLLIEEGGKAELLHVRTIFGSTTKLVFHAYLQSNAWMYLHYTSFGGNRMWPVNWPV